MNKSTSLLVASLVLFVSAFVITAVPGSGSVKSMTATAATTSMQTWFPSDKLTSAFLDSPLEKNVYPQSLNNCLYWHATSCDGNFWDIAEWGSVLLLNQSNLKTASGTANWMNPFKRLTVLDSGPTLFLRIDANAEYLRKSQGTTTPVTFQDMQKGANHVQLVVSHDWDWDTHHDLGHLYSLQLTSDIALPVHTDHHADYHTTYPNAGTWDSILNQTTFTINFLVDVRKHNHTGGANECVNGTSSPNCFWAVAMVYATSLDNSIDPYRNVCGAGWWNISVDQVMVDGAGTPAFVSNIRRPFGAGGCAAYQTLLNGGHVPIQLDVKSFLTDALTRLQASGKFTDVTPDQLQIAHYNMAWEAASPFTGEFMLANPQITETDVSQ